MSNSQTGMAACPASRTILTLNTGDALRRKAYCQKLKTEIALNAAEQMQKDVKPFVDRSIKEIMSNLADTAVVQKAVTDVLSVAQERLEYHIMGQITKLVPETKVIFETTDYGNQSATIINIDYKIVEKA